MAVFDKIFSLFRKRKPSEELIGLYKGIHTLTVTLQSELAFLMKLHKSLLAHKTGRGRMVITKTLVLKEHFIPRLKKLGSSAASRAEHTYAKVDRVEPLTEEERSEMQKIKSFLKSVKSELLRIEGYEQLTKQRKVAALEIALREVVNLVEEFHKAEQLELQLIRKVREHEISPLLQDVYNNPTRGSQGILTYQVTPNQLRILETESRTINACHDPDFWVRWRRWWRKKQRLEQDFTTPLKTPHINVELKLFGQQKKNVHLLVA